MFSIRDYMKPLVIGLAIILAILQYKLWFDNTGVRQYWQLKKSTIEHMAENKNLKQRNELLKAEIKDLKTGQQAIEEIARNDLGMVKKNETFYQVVDTNRANIP